MTERQLSGSTALVTGASRGFGRAIAAALAKRRPVVGVAATPRPWPACASRSAAVHPGGRGRRRPGHGYALLSQYRQTLVLAAGAAPLSRPITITPGRLQRPWETDVRQVFGWTREALLLPLGRAAP